MHNERGTVTAELAIALPVVIGVLVFGLGQVRHELDAQGLRQDLAYVAQALARQEPETSVFAWFEGQHPKVHIKKSISDGVLCVQSQSSPALRHCVWVGEY
jgi:hypothetical protein